MKAMYRRADILARTISGMVGQVGLGDLFFSLSLAGNFAIQLVREDSLIYAIS